MSMLIAVQGYPAWQSGGLLEEVASGGQGGHCPGRGTSRVKASGRGGGRCPGPMKQGWACAPLPHEEGATWGCVCSHRCPWDTRLSESLVSRETELGTVCVGIVSEMEGVLGTWGAGSQGGISGAWVPLGDTAAGGRSHSGVSGGGGRQPIPGSPGAHMSLTCVRRTRTSVQCAGMAGSSSAAMAAPGPSTWPACPHHSRRSPGEPGTHHLCSTQATPPGSRAASIHRP